MMTDRYLSMEIMGSKIIRILSIINYIAIFQPRARARSTTVIEALVGQYSLAKSLFASPRIVISQFRPSRKDTWK
jgi:hypothetical protein